MCLNRENDFSRSLRDSVIYKKSEKKMTQISRFLKTDLSAADSDLWGQQAQF